MAATEEISRVNIALSNVTPMNKAGLVRVDKISDAVLQAVHHYFGEELHRAVLQGDWSKTVRGKDALFLGK